MTDTSTINANIAQCLKGMSHWGFTRYHNVCSGTVTDLPWGVTDWLIGGGLVALMLAGTMMIIGLAVLMLRESFH